MRFKLDDFFDICRFLFITYLLGCILTGCGDSSSNNNTLGVIPNSDHGFYDPDAFISLKEETCTELATRKAESNYTECLYLFAALGEGYCMSKKDSTISKALIEYKADAEYFKSSYFYCLKDPLNFNMCESNFELEIGFILGRCGDNQI